MKAALAQGRVASSARAAYLAAAEHSAKRRARRAALLWSLPILLAPVVYFSVRALSRSEQALARAEVHESRIVTYVMKPHQRLQFPIEPNTDVLRIVAHAFARTALAPSAHTARLAFEVHGASQSRTETVELPLSGVVRRAVAEDSELTVGDPTPINIDVHDTGVGQLTLELEAVDDADGVLVRAYRREAISTPDTLQLRTRLGEAKRERLARRASAVDFTDLAQGDRAALVGARWRRLAALPDADQDVSFRALALTRPQPLAGERRRGALGNFSLRGNEQIAGDVRGPNLIVASARSAAAPLELVLRSPEHGERKVAGQGSVQVEIGADQQAEFEVGSAQDDVLALDASDESRVSLGRPVHYFRCAPDRPVLVDAADDALVVQVQARRPVARSFADPIEIALLVAITKSSSKLASSVLSATRARSRVDRYADAGGELAPSEPAVFRLLVPARARLALRPQSGELDLSLAELDPRAPPRPLVARSEALASRPEQAGVAPSWNPFEPRWPSNAADFDSDHSGLVRVVQRAAPRSSELPAPKLALLHVARPRLAAALQRAGRWFVRADAPIDVHTSGETALALPIRLYAEHAAGTPVRIEVDGGQPQRRAAAVVQRVTTSRSVTLDGETMALAVLGDDLAAGRHQITFATEPGTVLWVHLPWARRGPPRAPQWISGDFDP